MTRKPNPALMKPLNLSSELTAVIGEGPLPRGQVVKKLWEYIKANDLQDPAKKQLICLK
jgi:chromatin remodeling complex protein RSC6